MYGSVRDLPVVALTANAQEQDVKACLEAGMDAHVSKPIVPEQLHALLCRFLIGSKSPEG
jgi:CheY-like chemotaxis protein